jgi:hypothetical protein
MNSQETKLSASEIMEKLSNQDEIIKFFHNNRNKNITDIESIERYEAGEYRKGVILILKNNGDEKPKRIAIDIKEGQPTTDQVFDVIYGIGAECQVKFLLFTGNSIESDRNDPGASLLVVKSFVENIRKYGVDIYLIKVTPSQDQFLSFELIEPEDNDAKIETDGPMPTQEILRQHEFWDVYYWNLQPNIFMYPWECFEGCLDKSYEDGHMYGLNGLKLYATLNKKGLSFEVQNSGGNYNYLKTIWKCKKYDLQAMFPDSKMTYVTPPGKFPRIIIKMWNTPMSKICSAPIPEKKQWAERILNEFGQLNEMMDFALGDLKDGKLEEVQEFMPLSEVA